MNNKALVQLYYTLACSPSGVLEGTVHRGDPYWEALPEWAISSICATGRISGHSAMAYDLRRYGCCNVDQLLAVFPNLPRIPSADTFAYCVKSESAYNIVKSALAGKALDRFERAAVLEELYIY